MLRLLEINQIENDGIELKFKLCQYIHIWNLDGEPVIKVLDHMEKGEKVKQLAQDFVEGKNIESYIGEKFPLSILASILPYR